MYVPGTFKEALIHLKKLPLDLTMLDNFHQLSQLMGILTSGASSPNPPYRTSVPRGEVGPYSPGLLEVGANLPLLTSVGIEERHATLGVVFV